MGKHVTAITTARPSSSTSDTGHITAEAIETIAHELQHLRVIARRVVELAGLAARPGLAVELEALGDLGEELAGNVYRRIFNEPLPELPPRA